MGASDKDKLEKLVTKMKMAGFGVSGKGGVGKTTFAKALVHYMREHVNKDGKPIYFLTLDMDAMNGQLSRCYGLKNDKGEYDEALNKQMANGVRKLNGRDEEELASMLDFLDNKKFEHIYADMPGGNYDDLKKVFGGEMRDVVDEYKNLGYLPVVFIVIDPFIHSAQMVHTVIDSWGRDSGVLYVVVKSGGEIGKEEDFYFYDGDMADKADYPAELVEQVGGMTIRMPHFSTSTYALLDYQNVTFAEAIKEVGDEDFEPLLPRSKRSPLAKWVDFMNKQFDEVFKRI